MKTKDLLWVRAVSDTVMFKFSEELNPKYSVEGHEEQEEDGHVVDLLA